MISWVISVYDIGFHAKGVGPVGYVFFGMLPLIRGRNPPVIVFNKNKHREFMAWPAGPNQATGKIAFSVPRLRSDNRNSRPTMALLGHGGSDGHRILNLNG